MNDVVCYCGLYARRLFADSEFQLLVLIVLVAGLSLVHVVMAAKFELVYVAVTNLVESWFGVELAQLAATVTSWFFLVVVVFIWTREQRFGLFVAAVAFVFAMLPYLRGVVV